MPDCEEVAKEIDRKIKAEVDFGCADLKVYIRLHSDQDLGPFGKLEPSFVLLCNSKITLVHLSTLVCYKNGIDKDEWSNFEFYPKVDQLTPRQLATVMKGNDLRPLPFTTSLS